MLHNPKWDIDLDKPSLRALAYLLRHKELWPVGFEWDFRDCDRCAMGLAFSLWNPDDCYGACAHATSELLCISEEIAADIFLPGPEMPATAIMPELIADRIDAHTETASERR